MAKNQKNSQEDNTSENTSEQSPAAAHTANQSEPAPEKEVKPSNSGRPEKPKGTYLASSGDVHKFEKEGDYFVGAYTGRKWLREKADPNDDTKKVGDIMGYYFIDSDGVESVIGNSHQIEKSVKKCEGMSLETPVLYIEFLGKKQIGAKQFNQFDVILLDKEEERAKFGF